jgi:hypothetical protein
MAAVSDFPLARVVELRHLRGGDLDLLLDEETQAWREILDWDFRGSAGLVRRFLEMQALNGYALLINGYPAGYCYYVAEERKGLIGDLYVRKDFLSVENEERLLTAVIQGLMKTPLIRRIESQLMMLRTGPAIALPEAKYVRTFVRNFMEIDCAAAGRLPEGHPSQPVWFDSWSERKQDEAATLIAAAYQGHVDSEINDQYRAVSGLRQLLPAGVVRGDRTRIGPAAGNLPGEPGSSRCGARDAGVRIEGGARNWRWLRADPKVARIAGETRLPKSHTDGNGVERRSDCVVRADGIPQNEEFRGVRVGHVLGDGLVDRQRS